MIQIKVINHVNNCTGTQITLMPGTMVQTLQYNLMKSKRRTKMKEQNKNSEIDNQLGPVV